MILRIKGQVFKYYNGIKLSLKYDSVASSFSTAVYFDPSNSVHRDIFKPLSFPKVTLEYNGHLVLTGTIVNHDMTDQSESQLVNLSGYALPGVLENSSIPPSIYPLSTDGLSLKEITEKIIRPFGLSLVVDSAVEDRVNSSAALTVPDDGQMVKSYLSTLAAQRHVILSHDAAGNLVYTSADTSKPDYDLKTEGVQRIKKVGRLYKPLYHFKSGMPGVKISLKCNGQHIHSQITVQAASTVEGSNNGYETIDNPYGRDTYKPLLARQSSGDDTITEFTARNALSAELKAAISLTITMVGVELNGALVLPNNIVTVTSPQNYLFTATNWFICGAELDIDANAVTGVLSCVLPEVFNNNKVTNIFDKLAAGRPADER